MDYLFVVAGLILLFIGGESLVRGSVDIAKKLGISTILIGVVVVGFGTSAPELLVSLQASLANQPGIALGNVIGSNMANILLILGLTAAITPIACNDKAITRDGFAVLAASILLMGIVQTHEISFFMGALMVTALIAYIVHSYSAEKKAKKKALLKADTVHEEEAEIMEIGNVNTVQALLFTFGGIGVLVLGADLLVDGATGIALSYGISEAVIGLTLVALGTSLPEMATAIVASLKNETDVVIGNVLGSNLFNILSILGITALITPIPVADPVLDLNVLLMTLVALMAVAFITMTKKVARPVGWGFLILYAAYIGWLYYTGHAA